MSLESLREAIGTRTALLRSLHRLVLQPEFRLAFAKATPEQQAAAHNFNTVAECRWAMAIWIKKPLTALSYRQLRDLGQNNHVVNYSRITRDELIDALTAKGVTSDGIVQHGQESDRRDAAAPAESGHPGATDDYATVPAGSD